MPVSADRHWAWVKGLVALGLILFLPFLLLATPLAPLARWWRALLVLALLGLGLAAILGALTGASLPVLVWVEGHLRAWTARFSADPEELWLHWARHAHHPQAARRCLDQAIRLGGREALFQEALVFLEGGWGAGGQVGAVDRLRSAALKGHGEAAFRLADALRIGQGSARGRNQRRQSGGTCEPRPWATAPRPPGWPMPTPPATAWKPTRRRQPCGLRRPEAGSLTRPSPAASSAMMRLRPIPC